MADTHQVCSPKLTPEERAITGCLRVVRHVHRHWKVHRSIVPLKACLRWFKMGGNNLVDYLDIPPISDELVVLHKDSGATFLMPMAAWDKLSFEERAVIEQSLKTPKRNRTLERKRAKITEEVRAFQALPTSRMEDFE